MLDMAEQTMHEQETIILRERIARNDVGISARGTKSIFSTRKVSTLEDSVVFVNEIVVVRMLLTPPTIHTIFAGIFVTTSAILFPFFLVYLAFCRPFCRSKFKI